MGIVELFDVLFPKTFKTEGGAVVTAKACAGGVMMSHLLAFMLGFGGKFLWHVITSGFSAGAFNS